MSDNPIYSQPLSRQGRKNYDLIFRKPKAEFVATIRKTPDGLFRCTLSSRIEPSIWMKAIEAKNRQDLKDVIWYQASKRKWMLNHLAPQCPLEQCNHYGYVYLEKEIRICQHSECQKTAKEIAAMNPIIKYHETA